MEVEGKIKVIGETQTFGNNGFTKRELVVSTEEQYPQDIMIEFVKDKCDLLDSFQVGSRVKVHINLRGREWINPQGEAKYFNSLQGWRIEAASGGTPSAERPPVNPAGEEDDLPF